MASLSDIAGFSRKSFVPFFTFLLMTPGKIRSVFTPISTGKTSAPTVCAILQTEVFLFPRFSVTAAVISCPDWLMPSATTPLSAHMTITAFFAISISGDPRIAPILARSPSNSPRPSSGFATRSQFALISCPIFLSGSSILNSIIFPLYALRIFVTVHSYLVPVTTVTYFQNIQKLAHSFDLQYLF